jgi:hypothetical protein
MFCGVAIALALSTTYAHADPIVLNARQEQTVDGQNFLFEFDDIPGAASDGELTLVARGDYSLNPAGEYYGVESITLKVDGERIHMGGNIGPSEENTIEVFSFDDRLWSETILVPEAAMAGLTRDSKVEVEVNLAHGVSAGLSADPFVDVTLRYDGRDQQGMLFLMLPTHIGGALDGSSPLTLVTLSINPDGTIADTEWVIPDFGEVSLLETLIQNGITPLSIFGGGDIFGASPHVYSDDPTAIDPDVQEAIVNGLISIENDPDAFYAFVGIPPPEPLPPGEPEEPEMPQDISDPGGVIEGLDPSLLLGWFATFDPSGGEDESFFDRLSAAVFDGTVNILANSKVADIGILFSEDPNAFDEPGIPTISAQGVSQVLVPEPGALVMLSLGVAVCAFVARGRRKHR